jgi:hypothetical protein
MIFDFADGMVDPGAGTRLADNRCSSSYRGISDGCRTMREIVGQPSAVNRRELGVTPTRRGAANAHRHRKRLSYFAFPMQPNFHAGAADFLAGRPPRKVDKQREAALYEYGRLCAAHCASLGISVPVLSAINEQSLRIPERRALTERCPRNG